MFKTSSTAGPLPSIEKLDLIARKSGLITRKSSRFKFRGLKQSCRIEKVFNHKAAHHQMKALMLATMIHQILTLKTHTHLRRHTRRETTPQELSYEKLCDILAIHLLSLTKINLNNPFHPHLRHLRHDRRKRQTLYAKTIQSLT